MALRLSEGLGAARGKLNFAFNLDGNAKGQFSQPDRTAGMSLSFRTKDADDEVREPVDYRGLAHKPRSGVDHAQDLGPTSDALQGSKLPLETSEDSQAGESRSDIRLFFGDFRAYLAQRLGKIPVFICRPVAGDESSCSYHAHPWKGQHRSRRQLQGLRKDVAKFSKAGFRALHGHEKVVIAAPNVRVKRTPTAWRAGWQAQNGPQAQRLPVGAPRCWGSA